MEFINAVAGIVGISGTQLIIMAILAAIRAFLRIALRIFALGCVTILGIMLALYILFVVIR
jgi:hypothetical protein